MSGLVGWWPLHDDSAQDLSGNNNHGTLNGGVTTGVAGRGGLNAMSFNGTDGYISLSTFDTIGPSDTFSISMWVNTRAIPTSDTDDILHHQINNSDRFALAFREGEIAGACYDGSSWQGASSYSNVTTNQWYHVVYTYNGSTQSGQIHVNTELGQGTQTASTFSDVTGFDIGRRLNNDSYYNGLAFDLRVYNRVLSASEIQTLYEWGSGDYARPPTDGVARYPLDGNANDVWGTNDGTNNITQSWETPTVSMSDSSTDVSLSTDDDINTYSVIQSPDGYIEYSSDFEYSKIRFDFDGTAGALDITLQPSGTVIKEDWNVSGSPWYEIDLATETGGAIESTSENFRVQVDDTTNKRINETDVYTTGFTNDSIRGQAGEFDYTNADRIDTGITDSPSQFSVGAWVKHTDEDKGWNVIIGKDYWDNNNGWAFAIDDNNAGNPLRFSGPNFTNTEIIHTSPQNWYFVFIVYNGSTLKAYVNGSLVKTANITINPSSTDYTIGARRTNDGTGNIDYFSGLIDDVRIYDRALEPWEIFELYQWGTFGRDMRKFTVNQ